MGETAPPTILIVEDDPDVAETEKIVLEGEGYHTVLAASASEGLEQVHRQSPALILLDVMMPAGTEGFHFVWTLRQDPDPRVRNLPIIILSALHSTTKLRFYPEQSDGTYGPHEYLPVQGFLDKPVSSAALLEAVARALAEAPRAV